MDHYFSSDPHSAHRPGHVTLETAEGTVPFITDAGVFSRHEVDFGTRLLVDALLAAQPPVGGPLLDVGCGAGIIGLGLARLRPQVRPVLCDVNRRAVALARENAKALGIEADVLESDGFSAVSGRFAHIVTNPPIRAGKAVYYPWFEQAPRFLLPGGSFWCVVQKKQGMPSVKAALTASFGRCDSVAHDRGYHVLRASLPADPR
jgi:16S rRNA (guanine1207-N2)-methyltransferase